MEKIFDTMGVMVDCSRNAVYTVDALKRFMLNMEKMGYNLLMLYHEDTFEIPGEPYFGHFRGRFTQAEIRELDKFALEHGIELVPAIQTLAHLARLQYHRAYEGMFDCNDILNLADERTYDLIEKMFKSCSECYSTKKINVGMDEAEMVGLGKYLKAKGYQNRYDILSNHLHRVCELAKKYGFEPMMWSDMFFKLASGGYIVDDMVITEDIAKKVPETMSVVYWDYYRLKSEVYDNMFENHLALVPRERLWFAGGIHMWEGFSPFNEQSMFCETLAVQSCKKHNVRQAFFTLWGDDGAECSIMSVLPAMYRISRLNEGYETIEDQKAGFENITGIKYDDFVRVDDPNNVGFRDNESKNIWSHINNPCKYMLYADPFLSKFDSTIAGGEEETYAQYEKELEKLSTGNDYSYLFNEYRALCKVLKTKYSLGMKTRNAYLANDKETLKKLVSVYDETIEAVKEFHLAFRSAWMMDKKPTGFEVQDIRLGGLINRLDMCKKTICDYLDGKLNEIYELTLPLLDNENGGEETFTKHPCMYNYYTHNASFSII